jgi:hypothetical protein
VSGITPPWKPNAGRRDDKNKRGNGLGTRNLAFALAVRAYTVVLPAAKLGAVVLGTATAVRLP